VQLKTLRDASVTQYHHSITKKTDLLKRQSGTMLQVKIVEKKMCKLDVLL